MTDKGPSLFARTNFSPQNDPVKSKSILEEKNAAKMSVNFSNGDG